MKKTDLKNEHDMQRYCDQGLNHQEDDTDGFIRMTNPQKITVIVSVDFGDGYIGKKVHTIHAEIFWILFREKEILHVCQTLDKLKDAIHTIRRLRFSPQNTEFLMTGHQKEEAKKKEMENNLKQIEMI